MKEKRKSNPSKPLSIRQTIFMIAGARSVKCKILWFENSKRVKIINK